MSTEIPILYNKIRSQFDSTLKNAEEGQYVPKPKSVERLSKLRTQAIKELRSKNKLADESLEKSAAQLMSEYGISQLEAYDISLRVWDIENRLKEEGAFFGNEVFNFALEKPQITRQEQEEIVNASNNAMRALGEIAKPEARKLFPTLPMLPVESKFEELSLTPNAARLDFILTENGPKIIEINSQWVDAINALSAFSQVYGDQQASKKLLKNLSNRSNEDPPWQ